MNPLIKWPGGKSGEIDKIEKYIPKYDRYIEPFFGGGALFFYLSPRAAIINDISSSLMEYYSLIKRQDKLLRGFLECYNDSFLNLMRVCDGSYDEILDIYNGYAAGKRGCEETSEQLLALIRSLYDQIAGGFGEELVLDREAFATSLHKSALDKIKRTCKNDRKSPFSAEDMKSNLITGFTSGYYMYFRDVYNAINLGKTPSPSPQYKAANFYFIREYCYGSMFRYNAHGEFNIPYGGMSYNKKNMKAKIDSMFCAEVEAIFANTEIHCTDFEQLLDSTPLSGSDFMFLDPPYDSDFSDYEGRAFTKLDQERLARVLKNTPAQFMLVIKNTDFIKSLYEKDFNIISFDKQYTYNVKSRNDRDTEHLIITNLPT